MKDSRLAKTLMENENTDRASERFLSIDWRLFIFLDRHWLSSKIVHVSLSCWMTCWRTLVADSGAAGKLKRWRDWLWHGLFLSGLSSMDSFPTDQKFSSTGHVVVVIDQPNQTHDSHTGIDVLIGVGSGLTSYRPRKCVARKTTLYPFTITSTWLCR